MKKTKLRDRVREQALAKSGAPRAKEVEFHNVKPEGVETFRQQQWDRAMTRMNTPVQPKGSVLAPLVRNWVRVGCGVALGWVVTFLAQKGYLPVDAITPDDIQRFLETDEGKALVGAISLGLLGLVDAIWLKARKTGGAT